MTFGLAHRWRKQLVQWSDAKPGDYILDCATGTGDLALEFKRHVGSRGEVVGVDFCASMLELAPPKAKRAGLDVQFQLADILKLPFANDSFSVASIAYGIRNVADPIGAIKEMARVVKPGGRIMILETGEAPESGLKKAFEFYFQKVIPRIGGWVTGQRSAYEYLNRSSRGFPSRQSFVQLMLASEALERCDYRVLMGGASYLYRGVVR
jgi:demethylmenaquinone methyltransferase/2-methoxy-6-polyprenyl-1,4-benzoquinol methylase